MEIRVENFCPICNSKLKFYDGLLGYEALKCNKCRILIDKDTFILKDSRYNRNWIEAFNSEDKLIGQFRTPDDFKHQYPNAAFIDLSIYNDKTGLKPIQF